MTHPYKSASNRSFWTRTVARNYVAASVVEKSEAPLIKRGERVVTAGSCFASNLVPHLEGAGFTYLRTERPHPSVAMSWEENLGYAGFSAQYGNIYTVRQLRQLLHRSLGLFVPTEHRWHMPHGVIDPFRPGLRNHALSDKEFDALIGQHLKAVRRAFKEADVFIFTLGLTEAWVSKVDGAVFPVCPGTVDGIFNPDLHEFKNFEVSEIVDDLNRFIGELRILNPSVRVILTVSPVPLVATATKRHVLSASTYSKSVLRVAAEMACRVNKDVTYFPAYEIVTGPQAPKGYFDEDKRNVTSEAIYAVMGAFLENCEGGEYALSNHAGDPPAVASVDPAADEPITKNEPSRAPHMDTIRELGERLRRAACDEVMLER
jgi:hypothetical protein